MQEGETNVRTFAASDLGQLGIASTARSLYGALHDKKPEVRDAAHRALAELELQMGKPLPSPV
jgi:HEAT repeat protein